MSPLDALSPDQRAVLALLLKQGKRYAELAAMLRIEPTAVRQRAVAALDALGPETELVAGRRAQLTDWLLGQQDPAEVDRTLDLLDDSPPARAWVAAVAGELEAGGLGGDLLPELPAAAPPAPAEGAEPTPSPEPEPEPESGAEAAPSLADADDDPSSRMPGFAATPGDGGRAPASRLGGALLLAGIVIVLAVALIWALGRDGDDDGGSSATVARTLPSDEQASTTGTTPSEGGAAVPVAQINLYGVGGSDGVGVARLYEQGGQRVVGIDAEKLARNTAADQYALWLAGGPGGKARRLGFIEKVGRNGRVSVATALPANAGRFKRIVISRETTDTAEQPSDPALSGRLRLPAG